jgi:hypothetical protein
MKTKSLKVDRHGSTMAVRLFCKQGVVGSTPSRGSILDNSLIECIKVTYV